MTAYHTEIVYIYYIIVVLVVETPQIRVLLEKLKALQLVKKFPAFYGTRMFITVFTTRACK